MTTGDPKLFESGTAEESLEAVRGQIGRLGAACEEIGREPAGVEKILLSGFTPGRPLDSYDAFVDFAGRHFELGITEIVVHAPIPDSDFAMDPALFERIATEGIAQLSR